MCAESDLSLDAVSDDEIASVMLDRNIASLRDIQYTYGALYQLAFGAGDGIGKYVDISAVGGLIGEPQSLVVADIDLTKTGADAVTDVTVRELTRDDVPLTAYVSSSGNFAENSLTVCSPGSPDDDKIRDYAEKIFDWWPQDDDVADIISREEYDKYDDQRAVFESLRELSHDEEMIEALGEEIVERHTSGNKFMLTLRLSHPNLDSPKYPGEIALFNEATIQMAKDGYRNINGYDRYGEGTGYVSGEDGEMVGGFSEPLSLYTTKQNSSGGRVDPENTWTNFPESVDNVIRIQNSAYFVDGQSAYDTRAELTFYYLPYYRRMIPDKARKLFKILTRKTDNHPLVDVNQLNMDDDFGVYLLVIDQEQNDLYIGFEREQAIEYDLENLAECHAKEINRWIDDSGAVDEIRFSGTNSDSSILSPNIGVSTLLEYICSGWYLTQTHDTKKHVSEPDPQNNIIRSQIDLLRGKIDYDQLLKAYVEYIDTVMWDDDEMGSDLLVKRQFIQLRALYRGDKLTNLPDYMSNTMNETTQQTRTDSTVQVDEPEELNRKEKLDQMIAENEMLQSEETRAAFLMGYLVGRISSYQEYRRNMNRTLQSQYKPTQMNQRKYQKVYSRAGELAETYTDDGSVYYTDILEMCGEALLNATFENAPHHQFAYTLGVTTGREDDTGKTIEDEDNETDE